MTEVKKTDSTANGNMEKRDGETYIALGIFIVVIGIPVLLGTYWAYQALAPGLVIGQNPPPGTPITPGAAVDLVLSLGPEGSKLVTGVVGLTREAAEAALKADGYNVGEVTEKNDPLAPKGTVVSQEPAGGSLGEAGDTVDLVVSLGTKESVRLISLKGLTKDKVRDVLAADGFVVGNITQANSVPNTRGAWVNAICGVALILVGLASIGYGFVLLARIKRRA